MRNRPGSSSELPKRTCIYCTKTKAASAFNSEHVLSQGFGKVEKNLTLDCVCRVCNNTMGDTIETPGIRGSVEGIHRFTTSELRDPEAFAKTPRSRVMFERDDPEWEGVRVFMRLTEDESDVEEVLPPQVRANFKNGRRSVYLLEELPRAIDVDAVESWRAFYRSPDDLTAIVAALEAREIRPKWQTSIAEAAPSSGRGTVTARIIYDDVSRRLVAKIAFNYLTHVRGAAFSLKPDFNPIRRFIRYGEGRGADFVRPLSWPFLREEQETNGFRESDDHLVAIEEDRDRSLVGHVSLFNMIHNEIRLCRTRPETIYSGLLPAGSCFSWRERTIRPILHVAAHNLVQPPSVVRERLRRP
jgi:hypothetical protein